MRRPCSVRLAALTVFASLRNLASSQVLYSFSSPAWYLLNDARRVLNGDGTTSAVLTYANQNSAGQFWMSNPIFADAGWQVSFQFKITDSSAASADGICLSVQSAGLQAGSRGGGIGYAGVPSSVAMCVALIVPVAQRLPLELPVCYSRSNISARFCCASAAVTHSASPILQLYRYVQRHGPPGLQHGE